MRRFLITGLPRIRSAWLAALFSDENVRCFHDATHHGGVTKLLDAICTSKADVVGLIDPSAACVYPREALAAFEGFPVVMVRRDEEDCRVGLERWTGWRLEHWDDLVSSHNWFKGQLGGKGAWVDYDDLDNFETVAEVYRLCTGMKLDKTRFDLFNTLKIEQHFGKAERALMALSH